MEITLGIKIRELRKKHNLTQEDLAEKLSISAQAISKWEHWCAYLEEAGCLVKLHRMDEAKAKIDRAHYILMNSWKEKDSTVNYLENKPERYLAPFREYYSEWELDAAFPCPV